MSTRAGIWRVHLPRSCRLALSYEHRFSRHTRRYVVLTVSHNLTSATRTCWLATNGQSHNSLSARRTCQLATKGNAPAVSPAARSREPAARPILRRNTRDARGCDAAVTAFPARSRGRLLVSRASLESLALLATVSYLVMPRRLHVRPSLTHWQHRARPAAVKRWKVVVVVVVGDVSVVATTRTMSASGARDGDSEPRKRLYVSPSTHSASGLGGFGGSVDGTRQGAAGGV